ncbi:MAG TPA: response regulator [Polyangiaceae bacterium]|nr:response regulator [Polyangiaceae bacterium]
MADLFREFGSDCEPAPISEGPPSSRGLGRFLQTEAVLRAVIESPQQIVIFALDRRYRYLAYNDNHARTMRQIWGVQIDVGVSMLDLISRADDRAKARRNFDRALAGESFKLVEEYGDASKGRRAYEDVYSPVRDERGEIIGLAVYLTDITEHRQATQELERYRNQLELLVEQRTRELEAAHLQLMHAQKLESLGVLAGGIAHDFNNLLAVVLARSELCLRQVGSTSQEGEHLSIIRDTVLEARMLTRQLLSYAGKGQFLLETLNLNDIAASISQLLRASISKGIRLQLELAEDAVPVLGDRTQIRQVVLNLVTNAAEAIGQRSGTVIVRTGIAVVTDRTLREACLATELSAGSYAHLDVEDDGSGITDEVRARLFDPFFTTKFSGRGLGLAAVLGIVKSHHGTIVLHSRPAHGSVFRVLLPLAELGQMRSATPAAGVVEGFRAAGCALVVDDEDAVRVVTGELLRSLGYRVLEAEGGVAACRLMRAHAAEVSVVLLDLAMPDMNGEETLRELKKVRPLVPVILLTAYAQDEVRSRFLPGDLAGFVSKPFAREELIEALTKISAVG